MESYIFIKISVIKTICGYKEQKEFMATNNNTWVKQKKFRGVISFGI